MALVIFNVRLIKVERLYQSWKDNKFNDWHDNKKKWYNIEFEVKLNKNKVEIYNSWLNKANFSLI